MYSIMEKKVYSVSKRVKYDVVFGCSRADKSFSTLLLARKYARARVECVGCPFVLTCGEPYIYKEIVINQRFSL